MRFTKPIIAGIELGAGKSEMIVFDDALPGFGIRIRGGGKRTWIVQYRVGTKQRRLTLGRADVLDLDRARIEARRALAKAGLSIDPQAEKEKARADAALTLRPLFDRYIRVKEGQLRPNSLREIRRYLMVAWAPLHRSSVVGVSRADVAIRLGVLATERGAVAADRARAALSAFFTWAMREGIAPTNPVVATNRHAAANSRDRVLSDRELKTIWDACREDDFGKIVRLSILTGQRREEVAGMAWSEISDERRVWSLSASRTKNRRPHDVPLSSEALEVIHSVSVRNDRDLLFGKGGRSFSGWSKAKIALDKRIAAALRTVESSPQSRPAAIPEWRLHDLRRTVATRMADLGVGPHVIEALLNHVSGSRAGVAGIYNRALYAAEKQAALALWGAHVAAVVSGAQPKIVPLRRVAVT